jgi:hypothetical protein
MGGVDQQVGDAAEPEAADEHAWIIYQVVAARRLQWDNLVWQAPALSLTAQAFLLTITLSAGYETWPRRAAAALALVVSLLSLNLLARHRLSEIADAQFLAAFEERHASWLNDMETDDGANGTRGPVHGPAFRERRKAVLAQRKDGAVMAWAAKWTSSKVWFWGLALFGVTAAAVLMGSFLGWEGIFPPPPP